MHGLLTSRLEFRRLQRRNLDVDEAFPTFTVGGTSLSTKFETLCTTTVVLGYLPPSSEKTFSAWAIDARVSIGTVWKSSMTQDNRRIPSSWMSVDGQRPGHARAVLQCRVVEESYLYRIRCYVSMTRAISGIAWLVRGDRRTPGCIGARNA